MFSSLCVAARPDVSSAPSVSWRYIGAHTRQSVEKRAACASAAPISAGWMRRSAFAPGSPLTVG